MPLLNKRASWTPERRKLMETRAIERRLLKESTSPTKSKAPTFTEAVLSELREANWSMPNPLQENSRLEERGVILIKRGVQTAHAIKLRNRRFVVKQLNQAQRDIDKLRQLSDSEVTEN